MKANRGFYTLGIAIAAIGVLAMPTAAFAQGVLFVTDDKVGVGTDTPTSQLHVVSDTVEVVRLQNNGNVKLVFEDTGGGPNDHKWVLNNARTLRFAGDDPHVAQMTLSTAGNLVITGTLTTAGSTYPDYVFSDDYELMPLHDLAEYIEQNRHLPNVPSTDEVDGGKRINMSELQILLLEKVEELTLYTLEQQRTIEEQQASIASLRAEISEIKSQE